MKLVKKISLLLSIIVSIFAALPITTLTAEAAVTNPTAQPQISFTFDDGYASNLTKAAPALAASGYTGTAYITTNNVGKTNYLKWQQASTLQNNYNWEIGSHSVSHPLMSRLSPSRLETEVANSKAILQSKGFNPSSFATPYGDYDQQVIAAIARHYTSHRPFHDSGYNTWPYTNYRLLVKQVQSGVSVQTVRGYIDEAVTNNSWLILVFHDIKDAPSSNPSDYEYSTEDLRSIGAYAKSKNIINKNVTSGLVTASQDDNLLSSPMSANSFSNRWNTNAPTNVQVDTSSKGSMPEPKTSLKLTSATSQNVNVFSPRVAVSQTATYVLKGYANSTNGSGQMAVYIDEYDSNGSWISGQYKQTINNPKLKDISVSYIPSSLAVVKASVQFSLTPASSHIVYLDSLGMFMANGSISNPEPPQHTNLITNGTFDASLTGWSTDSASSFIIDSNNNGSPANPTNSIKLAATSTTTHLLSDRVSVDFTSNYSISTFVDIDELTNNELGFYIDEFDTNGNWISGQYVTGVRSIGSRTISFTYKPTSAAVRTSSLQFILSGNSNITGYIDNVVWVSQ